MIGWALSSVSVLNPVGVADLAANDADLADEFERAGIDPEGDVEDFDLDTGEDVLRPSESGPFDPSETLVRADLRETFLALASYAGTGRDTAYLVIADFANRVADRFQ